MLRNYFKIALRNFMRHKGYTALNIFGLAIGLAVSVLIIQYVLDEFSYDDFHEDLSQLYRVQYDSYSEGRKQFSCASAFPGVGPAMQEEFPEVESYGRMLLRYGGGVVRYEDLNFKENNIFMVEQKLWDMFSYKLLDGTVELDKPNTAVISEDVVAKYFGKEDPIGKRIHFGANEDYEITGVMQSPEHSHLKFHFMFSYPTMEQWGEWAKTAIYTNWGWYDFYNYIKVTPGTNIAALEAKFPEMINKYREDEEASTRTTFKLQAVADIHLYSDLIQEARVNGNGQIVYVLLIVALFILVIAWINYINLATARAMDRAREVGVRKVVGAVRGQLIRQFMFESLLLNLISAVLAIVLVFLATPVFNQLAGKSLSFDILSNPIFWLALIGLFLFGAILSGLYPAFILSSYKPVTVLKGAFKNSGRGIWLRRGLVGLQFFSSIFLIAGTMIIYQQISFMQNQDLGIDIEKSLVVNGPGVIENDSVYTQSFSVFKNEIQQYAQISQMAASSEIPGNLIYWTNGAMALGKDANARSTMYMVGVDYDYIETMGHELLAGRNYNRSFGTDNEKVIINETAISTLGLANIEEALNSKIRVGGDTVEVIGIMADYHQEGLKKSYDPIMFRLSPSASSYYTIKVSTDDLPNTIGFIQKTYSDLFPGNPFNYFFLDDFFDRQYQADQRFGRVLGFFAFLAILVACLGLVGLAAFSANQRRKEISIRKVLGSSVGNVLVLLSKEYIWLVLISSVLASALVGYTMNQWLQTFAFRISIGWWIFVFATLITLFIALATVSWQSLSVARANPAKNLRTE